VIGREGGYKISFCVVVLFGLCRFTTAVSGIPSRHRPNSTFSKQEGRKSTPFARGAAYTHKNEEETRDILLPPPFPSRTSRLW